MLPGKGAPLPEGRPLLPEGRPLRTGQYGNHQKEGRGTNETKVKAEPDNA